MASERQIEANRLNAQASTGPRTGAGKAQSRQNALKHGLLARAFLLPGEDPEEYRLLRESLIAELRPEGALESELVEQIVCVLWRMRRIPAFEAALMAWLEAAERAQDRKRAPFALVKRMTDQLWLGRTVGELLSLGFSDKLSRHAAALHRELWALLQRLREWQARRHDAVPGEKDPASRRLQNGSGQPGGGVVIDDRRALR